LTLDDRATRTAAQRDPTGFIADLTTPAVIDEIQRVPDVLLAIKQRVHLDKRLGRVSAHRIGEHPDGSENRGCADWPGRVLPALAVYPGRAARGARAIHRDALRG
jgi:hypothetical protein